MPDATSPVGVLDAALVDRAAQLERDHGLTIVEYAEAFGSNKNGLALCQNDQPVVMVPIGESDTSDDCLARLLSAWDAGCLYLTALPATRH